MRMRFFILVLTLIPSALVAQCKGITKDVDEFKNITTYSTPYIKGVLSTAPLPLAASKIITDTDTAYLLHFQLVAGAYDPYKKGLYVLFDNGEKWIMDETEIKCRYGSSFNYYSAYFLLDEEKIATLNNNAITKFKLFTHERTLQKGQYSDFVKLFKCIQAL
mgnify:CR=1 FL=1